MPRAGNASGGGQPGRILKCKGWETDPNAYIYFITQAPVWQAICDVIGKPDWKTRPGLRQARSPPAAPERDLRRRIEQWTMTKDKFEAMEILNKYDIPCGPILSMKEIAEDQSLCATGTLVEVDHPTRGKYLTVGNPDQAVGQPDRGDALAAAWRAHGGDPARRAGLRRRRLRRSKARARSAAEPTALRPSN